MEQRRFDRLARGFAAHGTRRSLLRGLSGLAAGSMAVVGRGHEARLARALQSANSEEQSVLLFEEIARIAHEHAGSCDDLRGKLTVFQQSNADLLAQHKAEQDGWTLDQRIRHADTYADRRRDASTRMLAAASRCAFVMDSAPAAAPAATPAATPAAKAARVHRLDAHSGSVLAARPDAIACVDTTPVLCVNPSTQESGPVVNVSAVCSGGTCSPCVDASYCTENYSSLCPTSGACQLAASVVPHQDCCQQQCPISTADCAFDCATGIVTPSDCDRCECSWCGGYSDCMSHCEAEDCCSVPCSSVDTPDTPPEGGP